MAYITTKNKNWRILDDTEWDLPTKSWDDTEWDLPTKSWAKTLQTYLGSKSETNFDKFIFKKVIFNPPATIVYWMDGTKTVVKCAKDEVFNESAGIALCMMKKVLGDEYKPTLKKALKEASRNYE